MTNDFFRNIPKYHDDSDFTTNAESYYKDLARKQKIIKLLSKKIWEYDKELAKRFEEWDKNLEEFPEDVKILLKKWVNDGTLETIINEEIFNMKPDRSEMEELFNQTSYIQTSEEPPINEHVDYWFEKKKSFPVTDCETVYKNVYIGKNEPTMEDLWLNTGDN